MKKNLFLPAAAILLFAACQNDKNHQATETDQRTVFFDTAGMDSTVKPGDNFFLYANGKWMKNAKIPQTETGWGSFYTLYNDNLKNLRTILENAAKSNVAKGSNEQKVGDFYASGMDSLTIEKLGVMPVKPLLAKIDGIKNDEDLINFVSEGFKNGQGDLFGFGVDPDDKMSSKNVLIFTQTGLNLPERSYYLDQDDKAKKIRSEYLKYITKVFSLAGDSAQASTYADHILKLETMLAKSHSTPVELRDPQKNYNKLAVADFQKQIPNINFNTVLKNLGASTDSIIVRQPKYYQTLSALIKSQPIESWKEKLKFDALNNAANALTKAFRTAKFEFFSKTLYGQLAQTERWKTMVNNTDNNLGDLLGQLYAEQYFKPEAKKRMLELVNNLQKVYEERIKKVDWMSAETKKKAIEKLNAFIKKIGYPDQWKKYDDVEISRSTYFANLQSARKHSYKEMMAKLGKTVDKTEWFMTPPTVNAYYNPAYNEIVFPAGILQFPFFAFNADDAINYGAIGAVIGHEMTHGFDDQGRQYDAAGNLKEWWTKEDAAKFKTKADKVVALYNKFTLLDNQHVNGALTLGENLADIGGLNIAYDAFKLTDQAKSDKKIDGFTPDQRFFLGFAQVWRMKTRDESMRVRIKTDPHSPEMFRVNGTVYNMEAFYKAFNIPTTAKMYLAPENRLGVW
ncbi:putative endopeptidase [Pedobacter psychrotolerans]|uniref:Peptidase M13 n=2 Tax=Pseudomonadati TaxID=3379134 RepID=A0A4R2HGL7_9SPHI|nr:M13 family metallopeptidase [Pedobacter psychrotolerans]TCO27234.1 putative endopeptidase [Pedobacter psychrotolerans]GGE60005.1 peptidase M13 [Pedobacter psychrotolerans]